MNWKEEFRNQVLPIDEDVAIELQINFISTEIIEKILWDVKGHVRGDVYEQLTTKWLN